MMLFIGVGTSMAQDKKAADADAPAKTEVSAEKDHKCSADCTKACCAKDGKASASKKECSHAAAASGDKTACAPGCEKKCCTADAGKAKKDDENHDHPH